MRKTLFFLLAMLCLTVIGQAQTTMADYETVVLTFPDAWDGAAATQVTNPNQTGINTSTNCMQTNTNDQGWGWAGLKSPQLGGTIDFTSGTTITMKTIVPFDCNVLFKLENDEGGATEVSVAVTTSADWQNLSFDFSGVNHDNGTYDRIVLIFDAGGTTINTNWYFDDIVVPGFATNSGEKVTFKHYDYANMTSGLIRVYDNGGTPADYTLYDDGTNGGDVTAGDNVWTAEASDLTGRVYTDAAGVGSYTWKVIADGSDVSGIKSFELVAGDQLTQTFDDYTCKPTATKPVIDGTIDAMWSSFGPKKIEQLADGSIDDDADFSATVRTAFDVDSVYFLFEITDQTLDNAHANDWEKDNIEIYLDVDNNDAYDNSGKDGQKRWIWTTGGGLGTSAQADVTGGWILELAIPFEDLQTGLIPVDGLTIGLDINANDNDGINRECILGLFSNSNSLWNSPQLLGDFKFVDVARLTMADDGDITEGTIAGEQITVTLEGDVFAASLDKTKWNLANLPAGVTISSIARDSDTQATITLASTGQDFDADANLVLTFDVSQIQNFQTISPKATGVTINAILEVGEDASLADLTVGGTTITGFDPETLEYNYELDTSISAIPTVVATVNETGTYAANAVVTAATGIPGTTSIEVTAYYGATQTYTINFYYTTPKQAAPTPPARLSHEVISIFSDAYTDIAGTNFNPGWGQATTQSIEDIAGNNTLKYANLNYQGTEFAANIDVEVMEYMHVDIWAHQAENIKIYCINKNPDSEKPYSLPITSGEWVSYDIPMSAFIDQGMTVENLLQLKVDGSGTIFLDNIYFYNSGDAFLSDLKVDGTSISGFSSTKLKYDCTIPMSTKTMPVITATKMDVGATVSISNVTSIPDTAIVTVTDASNNKLEYEVRFFYAAPTPVTRHTDSVISLYSNAYTDLAGTNFKAGWSSVYSYTEKDTANNDFIEYKGLNWLGITRAGFDASSMDYMHIDIWSPDATSIKLVINNADDTTLSNLSNNEWLGFDIPMSTFSGAALNDIYELKLEAGSFDFFIDNIYFYIGNSDASLADLLVDGSSVTGFDAATLSYDVELPYGTTTVPTVTGSVVANSTVEVTPATSLPGITTVKVTAEDGTVANYIVSFTIAPNTDASLSAIALSSGTLSPDFDAAQLTYSVELPYGTTIVPVVTATSTDANADTTVTAASTVPGSTTILVTAEDGTTTQTYTVNFIHGTASTDATLSDLKIDDVSISDFKTDSLAYEFEVPYGTVVFPAITYTINDSTATASHIKATAESKTDTVIVTAQDGSITKYTVKFVYVAASTDASLQDLALDGTTISGFKADSLNYPVELPFGTTEVPVVTALASHDSAAIVITQAATLSDTAIVVVTAQDGTSTKTYTVSFTVAAFISDDATLQAIKVNGVAIADFAADKYMYTIELPFGMDTVPAITGVKNNLAATVVTDSAKTLADTTVITVTAQDGVTQLVYKVTFTIADPVYDVTFVVSDGAKGLLQGAQIAFMLDTLTTDINGSAVFTQVSVTTDASYSVTLEGYEDVTGTLSVVDADVTKEIIMTLKTYDVKFNVADEAGKAIAMAEVVFQNDTVNTDSTGLAIFSNIAPVANAAYSISKAGYFAANGQLSVIDTAVVQNVILNLEVYNVSFMVMNADSIAIPTAEVILDNDTIVADSNGASYFTVAPGKLAYKVSKEGYFSKSDSISVVDTAVALSIILEKEAYDVTFTVLDGNANILKDAQVTFLGDTVMTDTLGIAIFEKVVPVADTAYTVSKDGYVTATGKIAVIDTAVNVNVVLQEVTYSVIFTVTNEATNAIEGAEVTVAGMSALTNAEGVAELQLAPVTDAEYTITKNGYVEASGKVSVIDADVNVNVTMVLVTYSVTFTVVDAENNAIEGAEVLFQETTVTTGAEGKAVFAEVSPVADAAFSVSLEGYETANGTVSVVDADLEIDIQLITVGMRQDISLISHMYPNPTSGFLNIELANSFNKAVVKVYSAQGQIVEHKELFEMHSKLDLSSNKAGIYLVNIELDGRLYFGRVIINK